MSDTIGLVWLRWIARVWSMASVVFVLAFGIGEGLAGAQGTPTAGEWVALALWPLGVGIGLAVAWWREGLGGAIATTCLLAFYAWSVVLDQRLPRGPWFVLVAAPGFLFLLCWLLSKRQPAHQPA